MSSVNLENNYVRFWEPRFLFEDKSELYGGSLPNFNPERAAKIVKEKKFTHVVVLLEGPWGSSFKEAYEEAGLQAFHFPIEDFAAPKLDELKNWVPQIINLIQTEKNKILIHCMGGSGRTGTIAACILEKMKGISSDEAIGEIRFAIPGAIETSSQMQIIKDFASKII